MRLQHGTLKSLSEKTGLPVTKLSDYAAARARPGRSRALFLEGKTGIDAAKWVFGSADEIKSALNGQSSNQDCP